LLYYGRMDAEEINRIMTRFRSPRATLAVRVTSRHFHWFALGTGVLASAICGALVVATPIGTSLNVSMGNGDGVSAAGLPIDLLEASERLSGISGETFGPGSRTVASEDILISAQDQDLARVMLEDKAEKRCLTVTAANGKTLSFRILGVEKAGQDKVRLQVPLAIAPCPSNGETVVKAVVEPDAAQAPKAALPEHSL
jgi:hypothetical protein